MKIKNLWGILKSRLQAQWIACKLVSDRRSVLYGIRFSYPIYISLVLFGVFLKNPYILAVAALIALLGMKLPLHPLDYVYNHGIAKLIGINKIPGRGSELQVNSTMALIFTSVVIALILFRIPLNYSILASLYLLSSIFFLMIFLLKKDFHEGN